MENTIRLRQVREEDCRLLWEWTNEPGVRSVSFEPDPIPWDTHVNWFTKKIQDPNCYIFIALDCRNTPIGQVRFDKYNQKEAAIGINISSKNQGLGYGLLVLIKALNELFDKTYIQKVNAFIKPDNYASIQIFKKAEFQNIGTQVVKGSLAVHYVKQKSVIKYQN